MQANKSRAATRRVGPFAPEETGTNRTSFSRFAVEMQLNAGDAVLFVIGVLADDVSRYLCHARPCADLFQRRQRRRKNHGSLGCRGCVNGELEVKARS
jgi:hypothetical protein